MITEIVEKMPTLAWFVTGYKFYQKYHLEAENKIEGVVISVLGISVLVRE